MCCDLSLRGPKHAQQRTTPQDRGVLLVSREEGQGPQSYLGSNAKTKKNTNARKRLLIRSAQIVALLLVTLTLEKFDAFQGRYSLPIH